MTAAEAIDLVEAIALLLATAFVVKIAAKALR